MPRLKVRLISGETIAIVITIRDTRYHHVKIWREGKMIFFFVKALGNEGIRGVRGARGVKGVNVVNVVNVVRFYQVSDNMGCINLLGIYVVGCLIDDFK